jgi:hypothetical protein
MKLPKVTDTQAQCLADSVRIAYRAGWRGNLRSKTAPQLAWGARPTAKALLAKGLVSLRDGYSLRRAKLTKLGVAVGEAEFKERYGVTSKEQADADAKAKQKEDQERQDRIDRVKHLFRGLSLASTAGYHGKKKTMAAHIDYQGGGSIRMDLDDLLVLGEQIEKLR